MNAAPLLDRLRTDAAWLRRRGNETIARDLDEAFKLLEAAAERERDVASYSGHTIPQRCAMPPVGWWCSRPGGHDGPCAARPIVGDW